MIDHASTPAAISSVYDQAVQEEGLSETHRYLLQQIPPNCRVLELGPASGYMTRALAERGCRVDAIELNEKDAQKAAPFCRQLIVGSVEDEASFSSLQGPYQVALMADILEHLREPEKTLQRIRNLLAPEGLALVSLPNIVYWRMRLEFLRGRFEYTDMGTLDRTHLRFFTLHTAGAMFHAAGFRVEKVVTPTPQEASWRTLKQWLRAIAPSLFAFNFVFHLRVAGREHPS